ncbi:TlpA disulfide reductase family protein [Mucilaginibacter sp. CSA2-8R]|uniref:TlpA disulfide reductase family protein n=1 Tax=Mucilaginibacter sp. CSA2-8R TaxID=3141542 RepID=UPI00315C78D2
MNKLYKTTIFLFLMCFIIHAKAQTDKITTFTIDGKIKGIDSGIIYGLTPDQKIVDSAVIVKGKFILNGKFISPGRMLFKIKPGNWMFPAFVDVSHISFDIDTAGTMHQYSNGKDYPVITRVNEIGSPLADAYNTYAKETGQEEYLSLAGKLPSMNKDSAAYLTSKMAAIQKSFPEKAKSWIANYVRLNPMSIPGIFIFNEIFTQLPDKSTPYLSSMLSKFTGDAKASSYYQALYSRLPGKSVLIGKIAPDFTLLKRDSTKVTLSSTRGSIVLLDFWASWCVPCRANIPALKKVYAKYHGKGLELIGISDDRKWSNWTKALDEEKMPWTQVIDRFPAPNVPAIVGELYGTHTIPYYVLIDQTGKIIAASGDERFITNKLVELFR